LAGTWSRNSRRRARSRSALCAASSPVGSA
jgi:hypothetical protein